MATSNEDLLRIQQTKEALINLNLTGNNLERLSTLLAKVDAASAASGTNLTRLANGLQRLYDQINAPTQKSVRVYDDIQMRVTNAAREVARLKAQLAATGSGSRPLNMSIDADAAKREADRIRSSEANQEVKKQAAQLRAEQEGVSVPEARVDMVLPSPEDAEIERGGRDFCATLPSLQLETGAGVSVF